MLPDRALFNVDCLDLLERIPSGKVQLVYLDPPFYGFRYPDDKKDNFPDYLNYLAQCLIQSRRILTENGNLALHFEPYNLPYVRLILDEIFGKENYKNEFIVPIPRFLNPGTPTFDVIVVYRKSEQSVYNQLYLPYDKDEIHKLFPYEDESGNYRLVSLVTPAKRPQNIFEWKGILPPKGYSWRYSLDRMNELFQDNQISYNLSKKIPSLKHYAVESKGRPLGSIWNDLPFFMKPDEKTGYISQQPLELLKRVIQILSNSGDMLLDPFCGSGTSLVAAQLENRYWIGCDISKQAVDLTLSRLKNTSRITKSKIVFGDKESVIERFEKVYQLPDVKIISAIVPPLKLNLTKKRAENNLEYEQPKPLIITEGKTDWKHIKAAFLKFKDSGYIKFEVDFDEFEEPRGDSDTLDTCMKNARYDNFPPKIFIFDRDNPNIVNEISANSASYKDWGKNVYAFPLPIPQHRLDTPEISVESYYQDDDLKKRDKNHRRLFLSNEFNPISGRHLSENFNCTDINRLKGQTLKIVDSKVFDTSNQNVALSKDGFATYILNGEKNFETLDIFAFAKIFEVIAEIMKYPEDLISIPIPIKTRDGVRKTHKKP